MELVDVVDRMACIVKRRPVLCLDVPGIAWFRQTEEVLTRGNGVGPGVTAEQREVMRQALSHADQHPVVLRRARVLVSAYRRKPRVWPGSGVAEPSMRPVSHRGSRIGVPFAKQPGAKLSDVLDLSHQSLSKLMLDAGVEHVDFGVFDVGGNGAQTS